MDALVDPQQSKPDDSPRVLDLVLDPPIGIGEKVFTTLHLEEPTLDQVIKAEAELTDGVNVHSNRMYEMALISLVAEVPRQAIGKLRWSQFRECRDFLIAIRAGGPLTGVT